MKYLERPINWIAAVILMAMIILANWAVFQRYVAGSPLQFSEEIGGVLLLWLIMAGAIAAERDKEHLSISFLVELLPARAFRLVRLLVGLVSVVLLVAVAWIGWQLANSVGARSTNTLRFSFYWIYLSVPLGFLGLAFYASVETLGDLRRLKRGGDDE